MQNLNPRYTPPTPVAAGDRMIAVARSGGALIPVTLVWLFAEGIMAYCHVDPWKSRAETRGLGNATKRLP
jgi:hypothetical protein